MLYRLRVRLLGSRRIYCTTRTGLADCERWLDDNLFRHGEPALVDISGARERYVLAVDFSAEGNLLAVRCLRARRPVAEVLPQRCAGAHATVPIAVLHDARGYRPERVSAAGAHGLKH